MQSLMLDVAGHRRSPATMPGYHRGHPPRNKGEHYPADPPTVEEIIAVMRVVGDRPDGQRLRALIVLLWRAGLRIGEALDLQESDLDSARGAILVRRGKGRASAARSEWTAGRGDNSSHGGTPARRSRSERCCIDSAEIISAVHGRPSPVISASAGLKIDR